MEVMVTKVLEGQRESDKLFMDLETKRMKMEQTVLELEHQRYQEDRVREESQCREERQFQMELYAMCGNPPLTYGTLPFPCRVSHGSPPPPGCIKHFTFNLDFLEPVLLIAVLNHVLSLKINNNNN